MHLPAGEGLNVLYTLADEWIWRRQVLNLLGALGGTEVDLDGLDTALHSTGPVDREERAEQIRQMVAAMGGEIVGG